MSTAHPRLPICGRVASNYNTHGNDENIMQERTASPGRRENGPSWCSLLAPPLITDRQSPHCPLTVRICLCQKPLWGKNRSVPKKVEEEILGGRRGLHDIKTNKQTKNEMKTPTKKNKKGYFICKQERQKKKKGYTFQYIPDKLSFCLTLWILEYLWGILGVWLWTTTLVGGQ